MPLIQPAVSVRNFVPSSRVVGSFASAPCGVAELEKMWHGQVPAPPVVYDQETGAPLSPLPATSVPFTVTVYVAPGVNGLFGVNVAVFVCALYAGVAATVWFDASVRVIATDDWFIASLKVTTTGS